MPDTTIAYRIAETREDVEGAVRLVYHNYLDLGYCQSNRFRVHFCLHDILPETRTLVAVRDGRVIAAMTLVFDSTLGLPSGRLYPAELGALHMTGRRAVEISKLSLDRDLGIRGLIVLSGLFRLAWLLACKVRDMTDFVVLVEPHHENFYVKSLLFKRIGGLKPDPEAADAPSVLLRLDLVGAPEKYRASFGDAPRSSNLYWFCCLAPDVPVVEDSARAADKRLTDQSRRIETGRNLASPTVSQRIYVDYRLFYIAFVVEKVSHEAEGCVQRGRFREEIEIYERLLAALPPDYAPKERAQICLDIATAAFHCALYERTLELGRAVREMALSPDLSGRGCMLIATALHFMGRRQEACEEIRQGLELPGLSAMTRARLLRQDGRMAVDRRDMVLGRRRLGEARAEFLKTPDTPLRSSGLTVLAQDCFVLEYRGGDLIKARAELESAAALFEKVGGVPFLIYHESLGRLALSSGRPMETLECNGRGLKLVDMYSNPFNVSLLFSMRARAFLALGRLTEAHADARQSLEFAQRARHPGVIGDAANAMVSVRIAEDDVQGSEEMRDLVEREMGVEISRSTKATLFDIRAMLAQASRNWANASEFHKLAQLESEGDSIYSVEVSVQQVWVELLSGSPAAAWKIIQDMPSSERMPGFLRYEAERRALRTLVRACLSETAEPVGEMENALAFYKSGGAVYLLADTALSTIEALRACRAADRNPEIVTLCMRAASEVCASARLPYLSRRLASLYTVTSSGRT
ncbi:MAG: hypothetical protein V1809_05255 [Planctomycetota bacterium]